MISDNLGTFAGKPVVQYNEVEGPVSADTAYRIGMDWDRYGDGTSFTDLLDEYFALENASAVQALVIGDWGGTGEGNDSEVVVEALVAKRDQLPVLKALFIGDMTVEESEISWINQSDMSPIWSAFPHLEEFGVRGGAGLQLGRPAHDKLRKLVIETGGLGANVVQELHHAQLPDLEHLELWLGDENYGADASVEDVRPLLQSGLFPKLRYLGLRNAEISDDIAAALVGASVLDQLEVLDLSLGTLGDTGVEALAANARLKNLKKLDIHFHYASEAALRKLDALGIEVDTSDFQTPDSYDDEEHRYVFASE